MNEKKCRSALWERAQGLCELCGKPGRLTLHHRRKRSQGGPYSLSNSVAVDGSGTTGCHGWIESHPDDAEKIGFHVRPWQSEEKIPILLHGLRWVKLDSGTNQYNYLEDEGEK